MTDRRDSSGPAVIVPAYARPVALRRLLASVEKAHYPGDGIKLIISLDGGATDEVVASARAFEFGSRSVEVIERDEQLGLREHILWCGDQAQEYGSVIVLEDDLVVDPWFYHYAVHAIAAHERQDEVAGIALYAPRYNEFAGLPFEPLSNGTSGYRMQVPCSWGQAWTARQWTAFKTWYERVDETTVDDCESLPDTVRRWPAGSWKKYFAAYLALAERYFVYPYASYTTNCSDPGGVNTSRGTDELQVPLPDPKRPFVAPGFPAGDETGVTYDPFMEPRLKFDFDALSLPAGSLCIDLYGSRPLDFVKKYDYCLTTRPVRAAIAGYPLQFRPLPMNILLSRGDADGAPIRLCGKDQHYDRDPWLKCLWARLRLRLYFVNGPTNGTSLLLLGLITLLKRLRDLIRQ